MATQVGEASVALKFDTKGASKELKTGVESAAKSVSSTLSKGEKAFSTWSVTVGNVAARAFEKVADVVTDRLEGGIERIDTLHRFPKVLQSIGYSAEDAAKATKTLYDYVQPLPTPFNDALTAAQRLAATTQDLDKATTVYKAMNNALLSGGANINRQSEVMNQWLQAVSRGKFIGNEWNDMMETMAGVMNVAAKELVGQTAGAENLRDAMSAGKITMEEFLDEIVKLNKEGSDNFMALEKQALVNTEGISTGLTLVSQSLEVVWKDILEAIGWENIQKALSAVHDGIHAIGDAIVGLVNWAKENKDWLLPMIEGVATFGAAFAGVLVAVAAVKKVVTGFSAAVSLLTSPIGLVAVGIAAVVALVVMNWDKIEPILKSVWEWIEANILPAIQSVIEWVSANVVPVVQRIFEMVGPIIQKIITFIGDVWTTICTVVNALMPVIQPVVAGIIGFVGGAVMLIIGLIEMIVNFISGALDVAIWTWENIISPIVEFVSGIISAIIGSVVWLYTTIQNIVGAIAAFWGATFNAIKDFVGSAINAIVSFVTGIPGRISSAVNDVKNFFIDAFNAVKDFIKGVVDSIVEFIMSIPSRIAGIGGEIAGSIMSGLGDIGGQIGGAISSGVSSAVSGLGGAVQGALSAIGLAGGGYVKATPGGTLAVIGEGGEDEFVIPRSKMIDILSGVATSPLPELKADNMRVDGGGIVVYNTYEINNELDADDIGRRINNSIRLATI